MKTVAPVLVGFLLVASRIPAPGGAHPWLFLTRADVDRARQGVRHREAFTELARALEIKATTNRVERLPSLERSWWETARARPWSQTYPEIFHHTFIVPARWAELARDDARASLVRPSPALVAKAKTVLLRLSDYTFEFEHYDVGMNYTIWSAWALEAYDILYEEFTPPERSRLDAFFKRLLVAVQKCDAYWVEHEPGGKLNNHYAWHKLCFGMVGLFYGQTNLVEDALHGPKGVDFMLRHGFKDNGLWLEGAIPYQFAATTPLLLMAELLENARYPTRLWHQDTADGRNLKQAYDALIPLLFPNRVLPPIGDCYGRRSRLDQHPDYETLLRRFGDSTYTWLIRDRQERSPSALFSGVIEPPPAPPPAQSTTLWPEMGYVALRSEEGTNYWSGRGWTAFVTYSGQHVHENADKLSLMLFGHGHLWLPDCEARPSAEHAFSSSIQSQLNRATICHNTLLVDGQSQRFPGQRLDLLEFQNLPPAKRVTVGDLRGRLYPGVRQLRTILVSPDYVLDCFQAESVEAHEFAWLTHVDGESVDGSAGDFTAQALPPAAPWSYLRDAKSTRTRDRYWEIFRHGDAVLRLDVTASHPLEVGECGFPLDDRDAPATLPMRWLRVRGTNAWFAALYRVNAAAERSIKVDVETGALNTRTVILSSPSARREHIVPDLNSLER